MPAIRSHEHNIDVSYAPQIASWGCDRAHRERELMMRLKKLLNRANAPVSETKDEQPDLMDAESDLIDALSESARDEQGKRHCSNCGRELHKGGFSVSLMGHGVFCTDVPGCVARMERLAREGSDHEARCLMCSANRPITALKITPHNARLTCRDTSECQRERDTRYEFFRRLGEAYPDGTPPGGADYNEVMKTDIGVDK